MADEILIRFSVKDDGSPVIEKVNQKLGETKKQSKALVPGLESARESLTGFVSQNAALIGVLVGVGAALKDVIDTGIKYAMTVDEMARAGGQSAEEASRFLQVLDDYEIGAEDALAATRALTNNGLAPNIETLAKLSDQYLSLNTAQEKNEFIIKNLGRGGLAWAKALEQGSAALLEQAAAVDKSLILTSEQVKRADQARLAIDNWNDSIDGLKVNLSIGLLPILTDLLKSIDTGIKKGPQWSDALRLIAPIGAYMAIRDLSAAHKENEAAMQESTAAATDLGMSEKELAEIEKATQEAAKALSDELSSRISLINNIQSADENYTEKSKGLAADRLAAEQELAKFRAQGYSEQSDQIRGALSDLDKIKSAEADLAKDREKQTLQFISNILAEQLARDGWTQAEFDAFAKQQEAWGLWSADAVAKSQAAWQEAMKITDAINGIPDRTVNVDVVTTYSEVNSGPNYNPYASQSGRAHAGGGSFMLPFGGGNESFMLPGGNTASPGETVTIDKAGSVSRTDELLEKLVNKETINEGRLVRKMLAAMQQGQGQ